MDNPFVASYDNVMVWGRWRPIDNYGVGENTPLVSVRTGSAGQ
jgi:hypothetical protein